ncbi:hypothetical protein [Actinacidiphila acididurans]|uniref:Tat pathway signal sequence domain protein n=1 Tax=Actinacidiphila acididurans TaxID=2784346 RepID=A0ABS2U3B6_9ACTN|nr:hypothetical protein [Actinacidiphila acididurans]MBM9510093.1 hypothetical protein [Actinacidiphila acididurans]
MSARIRRRVLPLCVAALVSVAIGSTTTAEAATTTVSPVTIVKKARKLPVWQVVIAGKASGHAFRRSALLALAPTQTRVTTNGVNPLDLCLISGTPAVQPQPGAIHFSSNSACYGYRSRLDMGYVKVSGGTATFTPDSRLSATFVNNHTSSYGVTACIYYPVSGKGTYTFYSNGVVRGTVVYSGFGGFGCGWSTYVAAVAGKRAQ